MPATPKARFLEKQTLVARHLDTVLTESFLAAADAAMLQMVAEMTDTTDPNMAAAGYHRIMGARLYLRHLQTVAEMPKPPSLKPSKDNLSQNQ